MTPRFYCPRFSASEAVIEGPELHHLRSVRRLGVGDAVEVFDGFGRLARCTLAALDRRRAELRVLEVTEAPPPSVRLTIATAIPKGSRMDWLVEKLTELGAAELWPLVAGRSAVRGSGGEKHRTWCRRAVEASKQCGRLWLPEIAEPMSLDDALARLGGAAWAAAARATAEPPMILLADPSPDAASLADMLCQTVGAPPAVPGSEVVGGGSAEDMPPKGRRIVGFIGPEGGFSEEEMARLRAAGAQPVRLAAQVLRVETAAVALAASVAALLA